MTTICCLTWMATASWSYKYKETHKVKCTQNSSNLSRLETRSCIFESSLTKKVYRAFKKSDNKHARPLRHLGQGLVTTPSSWDQGVRGVWFARCTSGGREGNVLFLFLFFLLLRKPQTKWLFTSAYDNKMIVLKAK